MLLRFSPNDLDLGQTLHCNLCLCTSCLYMKFGVQERIYLSYLSDIVFFPLFLVTMTLTFIKPAPYTNPMFIYAIHLWRLVAIHVKVINLLNQHCFWNFSPYDLGLGKKCTLILSKSYTIYLSMKIVDHTYKDSEVINWTSACLKHFYGLQNLSFS